MMDVHAYLILHFTPFPLNTWIKLQIWQKMIDLGYERIIVFEDDIRFTISSATISITDEMTKFS